MKDKISQSIKSQLDKLEKISNQISLLISAGEYGKISHLDKIRKKIINDMNSCNYSYDNHNKESVLKLISQNQKIISKFKKSQRANLANISKHKKCTQAYLATF
jgi:UDP-N-acetylglucosamine transferase subunit ALG13